MESYQGQMRKKHMREPLMLLALVVIAAVAVVAFVYSKRTAPEDGNVPTAIVSETEPVVAEEETTSAPIEPTRPALPEFDIVRVDGQGAAVIAGTATPGQVVDIVAGTELLGSTKVDGEGKFVALLDLPRDGKPRSLELQVASAAGLLVSERKFLVMAIDPVIDAAPKIVVAGVNGAEVIQDADPLPARVVETAPETPATEDAQEVEVAAVVPDTPSTEETSIVAVTETETVAEDATAVADADTSQDSAVETVVEETVEQEAVQDQTVETAAAEIATPTAEPEDALPSVPEVTEQAEQTPAPTQPEPEEPVLASIAPDVASDLTLDTISYSQAGDVVLSGRGLSDSAVRVYVDNKPVQLGEVRDGKWRLELPDVDEGIYTVRVDALDAQGDVTARVESPFKRETPNPDAIGPEVTIQPGFTLWQLAELKYGEGAQYVQIFEANRDLIKDPDLIYPGQIFDLPAQ